MTNIKTLWQNWVRPRSQDRDEAFRERTLRVTTAILLMANILSVTSSPFFTPNYQFKLVSLDAVSLFIIPPSAYAAYLVHHQQLRRSGWMLIIAILVAAAGVTLVDGYWGIFPPPVYMLTVLFAAVVLPRKALWRVGVIAMTLYTFLTLLQLNTDLKYEVSEFAQIIAENIPVENIGNYLSIMYFLIIIETLFLRQLRIEFDERFAAMQKSIVETEKARREAERANQSKSRFFAKMTHELRTPLNAIIGYIEIMMAGMVGEMTDKQKRYHENIHINSKNLLNMINDVLDLSKVEAGRLEFHPEPASPQTIIENVANNMQSLAERKSLYLKTNFASSTPTEVVCDARRIEQVLINLIGNALKFTKEGGVELSVRAPDPEYWQIAVKDTGIGIPPDHLNNIFEIFSQVNPQDTHQEGSTGLGLSITRELVGRMGGTVKVESELDKGSTFTIILPQKMAAA